MSDESHNPQGTGMGGTTGWTDQHGVSGSILLGRQDVLSYAPPKLGREWLDENVVGVLDIRDESGVAVAVYVTRQAAEDMLNALARELGYREKEEREAMNEQEQVFRRPERQLLAEDRRRFLDAKPKIGIDDLNELPDGWRIDVCRAFRGLEMTPSWQAQLLTKPGRTWKPYGEPVLNDDGPREAISDLLVILDSGEMPV